MQEFDCETRESLWPETMYSWITCRQLARCLCQEQGLNMAITSGCLQSPNPQCPVFWPMLELGPDKRPNLRWVNQSVIVRSFSCWGRMQCASVRLREPAIAINLLRFTNQWRKLESIKTPHSIVVKVFFELSACHKTKPLCKIWLRGVQAWPEYHCCRWIASKVKHSESAHLRKWARDHLQELPLQGLALPPPHQNISCREGKHRPASIYENGFQLDKNSPALALSHKARALSMGTIWSSQHRTLHQQRISRVTGPQPAIKLAERRSCSPSLRATTARAHPQGRSDENNMRTTFRNDLPIHFLHWEVSPVRWHLEQAGSEFCSCVHLGPRRFGLVASTKCKNCEQQIFSNPTARDNVACPDWLWRKTWAIIGCNTSR